MSGLVQSYQQIIDNAVVFADSVHDQSVGSDEARHLLAAGRVYLPFRYSNRLAFAPAKFIGYEHNDMDIYMDTAVDRSGSRARQSISRVLGFDAEENIDLEMQLENYCLSVGVELWNHRHSFWQTKTARRSVKSDRSAILDIDTDTIGNDDPEYRRLIQGRYVRDEKVRRAVLERAAGKCEYCGVSPFSTKSGIVFLEAHHVIALSEQGPDTLKNVIALCPNHHREAHFGENWKMLQSIFLEKLREII